MMEIRFQASIIEAIEKVKSGEKEIDEGNFTVYKDEQGRIKVTLGSYDTGALAVITLDE